MKHRVRPAVMFIASALLISACASAGSSPAPSDEAPPNGAPDSESPGIVEPQPGGVELVEPEPGQQNVHPVTLERMDGTASGTVVSVDAYWTSGVDPCYVLDRVEAQINEEDKTVDITVQEGTSDPDAICVMMAVAKHTIVSFDVPSTGTWTIRDSEGGAPPVEVVVS